MYRLHYRNQFIETIKITVIREPLATHRYPIRGHTIFFQTSKNKIFCLIVYFEIKNHNIMVIPTAFIKN